MRKLTIYGMGSWDGVTHVILGKNEDFFKILSGILFEAFKIHVTYIDESENKKGEWVVKKKRISSYVDRYESFSDVNFRVHCFFGKDKVFLTCKLTDKGRTTFAKVLEKYCKWTKKKVGYKAKVLNTLNSKTKT